MTQTNEFIGYPEGSTASSVLQALKEFLQPGEPQWTEANEDHDEGWVWRWNIPWRAESDSFGGAITIHDEVGEYGTWKDFVTDDAGSLYDLAERLGIEIEKKTQRTTRSYTGLADYALEHGVEPEVFEEAGWKEGVWFCPKRKAERPALIFKTIHGNRVRFIDGLFPKYGNSKGYKACWYGLSRAIQMAKKFNTPLILCNGEPSTVCGQHWQLPAFSKTSGGEKQALPRSFIESLREMYPEGEIWVVLDCDQAGRKKSPALSAQLRKEGWDSVSIDLGYDNGFDLANWGALHGEHSLALLTPLAIQAKLQMNAQPKTEQGTPVVFDSLESDSILSPVQVERSTLAILLSYPQLIVGLPNEWSEAWYSTDAHKVLATVLRKMSAQGVAIDHVTVWQKLSELGKSTLFGSTKALAHWRDEGIDSQSLDTYMAILLDAAQRRQWVQTAYELLRSARDSKVHVNAIRQRAEQSLLTTANSTNENRLVSMSFAVEELWDRITGNMPPVMYSNIAPLDRAMQGASEGSLICMAGRPGGGKTALAVHYALELALQDQAVVFFSQEVPRYQIVARIVSCAIHSAAFRKRFPGLIPSLAAIPYSRIIKAQLTDLQFAAFSAVSEVLHQLPIWTPYGKVGLDQIKSESRSVSEKIGFPVVPIVDYLQFMEWPSGIVKENEAVGRNAYGLKELADTDYCHHAVFLSQMNRGIEGRTGQAARMSDVEGSGKIEQAATDLLVFLPLKEKDEEADTTEQEEEIYTDLSVDYIKSRNGQTGLFSMRYAKSWNYFADMEPTWRNQTGQ